MYLNSGCAEERDGREDWEDGEGELGLLVFLIYS